MIVTKQEFFKMLANCENRPMYWQHTGFIVKKINNRYMIFDELHNTYHEILDVNNTIMFNLFYNDFFN